MAPRLFPAAPQAKNDTVVTYSAASSEQKSSTEDSQQPHLTIRDQKDRRSVVKSFAVQIFGILWLVPTVLLLYLNFSGYVVGASAWCPGGQCWVETFNPDSSVPENNLAHFAKNDENLNGALQVVAKLLEVWFVFISTALVYITTMKMASSREGLPIGCLARPIEFADPVTLVDPLFWTTGPPAYSRKNRSSKEKKLGRRIGFLLALSVFLCLLCNLMGPATAVLVIPALQWVDTAKVGNRQFTALNSAQPPLLDWTAWFYWNTLSCSNDDLQAAQFACSYEKFGTSLDAWLAGYIATNDASAANGYINVNVPATQDLLTFAANATLMPTEVQGPVGFIPDIAFWSPSRQIVSNLSTDYLMIASLSRGVPPELIEQSVVDPTTDQGLQPDPIETYVEYNKSRELEIHRNGPIMGATATWWSNGAATGSLWTVRVDAARQLRCYPSYEIGLTPGLEAANFGNFTKCIRTGSGWSDTNADLAFSIAGQANSSLGDNQGPNVDVRVFSSDRAVFLPNGMLPEWLPPACLRNGSVPANTDCDWDRLFSQSNPATTNREVNINTIEYTMRGANGSSLQLSTDFNPFLAFTDYSLNPSPIGNPTTFVKTSNLPISGTSVALHPAWILAAWAANADGLMENNRTTTTILTSHLTRALNGEQPDRVAQWALLAPIFQTLSLVDHSTRPTTLTSKQAPPDHPLLQRSAKSYVWAFSMSSGTAQMGATVAILGCIVVLIQVGLGFTDRRRYRSPTHLIVAALEHVPRDEFVGKESDENAMAGVRFRVRDDGGRSGKFSFYETEGSNGEEGIL